MAVRRRHWLGKAYKSTLGSLADGVVQLAGQRFKGQGGSKASNDSEPADSFEDPYNNLSSITDGELEPVNFKVIRTVVSRPIITPASLSVPVAKPETTYIEKTIHEKTAGKAPSVGKANGDGKANTDLSSKDDAADETLTTPWEAFEKAARNELPDSLLEVLHPLLNQHGLFHLGLSAIASAMAEDPGTAVENPSLIASKVDVTQLPPSFTLNVLGHDVLGHEKKKVFVPYAVEVTEELYIGKLMLGNEPNDIIRAQSKALADFSQEDLSDFINMLENSAVLAAVEKYKNLQQKLNGLQNNNNWHQQDFDAEELDRLKNVLDTKLAAEGISDLDKSSIEALQNKLNNVKVTSLATIKANYTLHLNPHITEENEVEYTDDARLTYEGKSITCNDKRAKSYLKLPFFQRVMEYLERAIKDFFTNYNSREATVSLNRGPAAHARFTVQKIGRDSPISVSREDATGTGVSSGEEDNSILSSPQSQSPSPSPSSTRRHS